MSSAAEYRCASYNCGATLRGRRARIGICICRTGCLYGKYISPRPHHRLDDHARAARPIQQRLVVRRPRVARVVAQHLHAYVFALCRMGRPDGRAICVCARSLDAHAVRICRMGRAIRDSHMPMRAAHHVRERAPFRQAVIPARGHMTHSGLHTSNGGPCRKCICVSRTYHVSYASLAAGGASTSLRTPGTVRPASQRPPTRSAARRWGNA